MSQQNLDEPELKVIGVERFKLLVGVRRTGSDGRHDSRVRPIARIKTNKSSKWSEGSWCSPPILMVNCGKCSQRGEIPNGHPSRAA